MNNTSHFTPHQDHQHNTPFSSSDTQITEDNFAKTVIKRDGRKVLVEFDKITRRIRALSYGLQVEPTFVAQKVFGLMSDNMKVSEIDEMAAQCSAFLIKTHIDYLKLASRLMVSNLHKETPSCFSEAMEMLYHQTFHLSSVSSSSSSSSSTSSSSSSSVSQPGGFLSEEFMSVVRKHAKVLDAAIQHNADYLFDYFAINTLINKYLLKVTDATNLKEKKTVERPQYMFMRVALFLNMDDIPKALQSYELFSQKIYTHASPTLFNAGKPHSQCSSCFLLQIPEDSLVSIYDTLKECAMISKLAGGIGLSVHRIRAEGSLISTSGGYADGLVPMLKVFNDTARYVNQNGHRKGAFAIYIEPWHSDIFQVLDLKKNNGAESERARDLHYGLWIPDLFMQRVNEDGEWSLFSPDVTPDLCDLHSEAFEKRYREYESKHCATRVIKARELWSKIVDAQIETGEPYMLYKDACNRKSNQQHLGTIHSSNLCTEIVEYTSADEIAVCNLASICLPAFVDRVNQSFDHKKLFEVTQIVTQNLDKVIDLNYYPLEKAKNSNMRHRPIGIGVQGLADTFAMLMYPFDSPEAIQLNKDIFETIYFGAVTASKNLAKLHGPYSSFQGSPASKGFLQFDLWGVTPSNRWNWKQLKDEIKQHGLRNSLLLAPMPTQSTSQIMSYNEACETFTSNIFVRRVGSGDFVVVNPLFAQMMTDMGFWSKDFVNKLIAHDGSIRHFDEIPQNIKDIFKTAYEIKTKTVINMAADRGAFICQSQSMNLLVQYPTKQLLTNIHMHAWKSGLKTGMYYLRSRSISQAQKITVDPTLEAEANEKVRQSLVQTSTDTVHKETKDSNGLQNKEEDEEEDKEVELDIKSDYSKKSSSSDYHTSSLSSTSVPVKPSAKKFICNDEICISCGS